MLDRITPKMTRITSFAIMTFFAMCLTALAAQTASGATFTVTITADSGAGSLRQAISDANAASSNDTIDFNLLSCPCTITLTSGELEIANNGALMINGLNANQLTVRRDGNAAPFRIFRVDAGATVSIAGLTIEGGLANSNAAPAEGGGGIKNDGSLTVSSCHIRGNSAQRGIGVSNYAGTAFGGNGGDGGGILNDGILIVESSLLTGNSAGPGGSASGGSSARGGDGGQGGAIASYAGTVRIRNSTFSGNRAGDGGNAEANFSGSADGGDGGSGGAIYNSGSSLSINNSTITDNGPGARGSGDVPGPGGIPGRSGRASLVSFSTMDEINSTIVANTVVTGRETADVEGSFSTGDYNLVETPVSSLPGQHNLTFVDPMLGPLAHNGGTMQTHALLPSSPAIDMGINPDSLSTDQRGVDFPRTIDDPNVTNASDGDGTDIGAAESNFIVVNTTAQDDDRECQPLPDGDCTLREAILAANAAAGTETIIFDIPTNDPGYDLAADRYTISLLSALPDLAADISISGLGAKRLTVRRGAGSFRIFNVPSDANIGIFGLTISGGSAGEGGGIWNAGTLSITGSVIRDNSTHNGTSPFCDAANRNAGSGGGIYNLGNLTVDSSSFIGNRTGSGGEGNRDPDSNCWWEAGSGGNGGAISNDAGTLIIRNSTFSGNGTGNGGITFGSDILGTGGMGAAIYNRTSLSISNASINGNVLGNNARGGVFNESGAPDSFHLESSIVANTDGQDDIAGIVTSGDFNLAEDPDGTLPGSNNLVGVDPKLGPLADNGGPTPTHTLLCGSPAMDKGKNLNSLTNDQRGIGFTRILNDPAIANATGGDGTDIGALELQETLVCNTAPMANSDSRSTNEDTPLSGSSVLANDTDGENDTLTAILVSGPTNAQWFTLNADGSFSYTPSPNFNGSDSFTYNANDGSLDSNVATVTITVNPINDPPTVTLAGPAIQTVQYSDRAVRVTWSATDVDSSHLQVSFQYLLNGETYNGALLDGGGGCGPFTCSLFKEGNVLVPAGVYTIRFTVTDGSSPSVTSDLTLTVIREDATVTPSVNNPASVKVNTPGWIAGPVTLCAEISDAADGNPGDIALAVPVRFVLTPVAPGGTLEMVDTELSGGSACVTLATVPVNVYDVTITVEGNYYTGSGSSVLAVFDPTLGFTTGGGRVLNSAGNTLHFGFSFKYDKKGFKGQMLVMEHHPDGSVTRLKSNSLTSLSIVGRRALVLGKANILYANGTSLGNLGFRLDATDNGEPGSSDLFGLKTTTSGGASIASFSIDPRTILSGNIQVPQAARK